MILKWHYRSALLMLWHDALHTYSFNALTGKDKN